MAGELGTAVVRTEVDLDGLDSGFNQAEGKTRGWVSNLGGTIAKVGGAAVVAGIGAVVAGVAAIGGAAVVAAKDFVAFEQQMNEVFTLMPGISADAMESMTGQVKDFAVQFGVLPEEVVPALYQSLSAGVPADNVFSFLETAQKAAAGGVTDLTTAVDGISSVVNAYGADVLSAAAASDAMFTAVRLGKTNFEELSSSLFNVTPTAASLGVTFEDVTAQLAVLTAQGVPTSVATTQMRAAMNEAAKSGTLLSDALLDLTGQTFPELIAQGKTMPEVFEGLRQSMPEQEFRDLFGSVEAMNAVLGITGPNFDTVTGAMEEMENAAGATDAAFETMDGGLQATINRLKATGKVALLDFATAFEPLLARAAEFAENALPKIQDVLENVLVPAVESIVTAISGAIETFQWAIDSGFTPFEAAVMAVGEVLDDFIPEETMTAVWNLIDGIIAFKDQLVTFLEPIITAIGQFVSWKDVLIALGAAIAVVVGGALLALAQAILPIIAVVGTVIGVVALLRNAWENNWGGIQEKTRAVITFVQGIITTVVGAIRTFWEQNGAAILASAQQVWQTIQTVVTTVITTVQAIIQAVTGAIRASWDAHGADIQASAQRFWEAIRAFIGNTIEAIRNIIVTVASAIQAFWDAHGAAIKAGAEAAWEGIKSIIDLAMQRIRIIFDTFAALFSGDWQGFLDGVKELWQNSWDIIVNVIGTLWDAISPLLASVWASISGWFSEKVSEFARIGSNLITALADAISTRANNYLRRVAQGVAALLPDWVKSILGIASPSRVFMEIGFNVGEGLAIGLHETTDEIERAMMEMGRALTLEAPRWELAGSSLSPVGIGSLMVDGLTGGSSYEDNSAATTIYGGMHVYESQRPRSYLEELQDAQVPG